MAVAMAFLRRETRAQPADGPSEAWVAVLVRLLGLLGRNVEAHEVRAALADAPGDGHAALLAAAARLGLALRERRPQPRTLRRLSPPFLVLAGEPLELRLVRGRTGNQLVVVDGATAHPQVWTAQALAAVARSVFEVRRASAPAASGLWALVRDRRHLPALAQIVFASVLVNLLALTTPLFMMAVYNKVLRHAALTTLDALVVGMLALAAFELALRSLRGYLASFAGARLDAAVGRAVIQRLLRLPFVRFVETPPALMLDRLRQLDQLRTFLTGQLPILLVDLAFVGLFVAALFLLAPILGLLTLLAVPPLALLGWLARRAHAHWAALASQVQAHKHGRLLECLANALTVKALGLEPEMEARLQRRIEEGAWTGHRAALLGHVAASAATAIQHLIAILLVYQGARMVVAHDMTIGALVAATILAARALAPIRQLFLAWPQLQQAREAVARIDALLREPMATGGGSGTPTSELVGAIRLEQVSFRYRGDGPAALDRVDLELQPGTMLAVLGPPGSGKSTLARLLAGVLEPSEGRVLVDGFDLAKLAGGSFRRRIGVVPQELQLFEGTIAENIALGAEDGNLARVVAAARFVGLHDLVQRLPEGYDTRLGERGAGLSAGQKQLVCLARAVVRNPRILILDEATSALDPTTEARLLANLRRAGSGRTILLVTHRPSAALLCDRAILLDGGRILFDGAPAEAVRRLTAGAMPAAADGKNERRGGR